MAGSAPSGAVALWSNSSLQPFTAGVLTPFSYSVLAELASRGWYAHYDQLGFKPAPRSRLVRQYKGRAYLNRSISAQLESEQAGIEPMSVQINGQTCPIAAWEKPGFLGGFKLGRMQRKLDEALTAYSASLPAMTEKARTWYIKTLEVRWSQAEVLQVMEEIERVGAESMALFLAARHNLEWLTARVLADLTGHDQIERSRALLLINNALCTMQGLVEFEIADAVAAMGETLHDPEQIAWLKHEAAAHWQEGLPGKQANDRFADFLDRFGHRAMHEGEMAQPRWHEDPTLVLRGLLVCAEHLSRHPAKLPAGGSTQKLIDHLSEPLRKQGQQMVAKMRDLHYLQSRALHALAYIWAGTRRWALAAAAEAMADGRLTQPDDVFFFELEEIKQMMTGEWNLSSREEIQATAAERRAAHDAWQKESAPPVLVGDAPAEAVHHGLPGAAGHATGPLRRWGETKKYGCSGAILGSEVLDSGWALTLPLADGFVSAGNTPMDPFVAAARAWQRPVMVGLGPAFRSLTEGAYTTLDVSTKQVKVEQ